VAAALDLHADHCHRRHRHHDRRELRRLTQTNTKRLLAYSSIAHVGYMLLALVAMGTSPYGSPGFRRLQGNPDLPARLHVHEPGCVRRDHVVAAAQRDWRRIDDMAGLYQRAPVEAVLMLLFLLSLAGIPPAAGFLGKYYIFLSLIESGHYAWPRSACSTRSSDFITI
jgi:NADH-quinone oxidoreductase subunit N